MIIPCFGFPYSVSCFSAVDGLVLWLLRRWDSSNPRKSNLRKFESEEIRARQSLIYLALIRSPFFEATFERPLQFLDRMLKRIPVLNWFKYDLVLIISISLLCVCSAAIFFSSVFGVFLAFRSYHFFTSGT